MRDNNMFLLVDDYASAMRSQLNSILTCDFYPQTQTSSVMEKVIDPRENILESYEAIFLDASLKDKYGVSCLDIAEKMAQRKPHLLERVLLLVGSDMMTYSSIEDHHAKLFISRVKQFPYMVHGGENGSKLDCIVNYIELLSQSKNLNIQRKLPVGACRLELAEMVHADIYSAFKKAEEQLQIIKDLKNKIKEQGYQPITEDERELFETIEILENSIVNTRHSAANANLFASLIKRSAKKSQSITESPQPQ